MGYPKKNCWQRTDKSGPERVILNAQLRRLEEFRGEPVPPDWAMFKKLAEYWAGAIAFELDQASDDVKAKFAELFDLYLTIHPDSSRGGYHFDLSANIPLEMEGSKPGAYEMVFSPPRGGFKRVPRKIFDFSGCFKGVR